MMEKIKNFLSAAAGVVVAIIGVLFLYERGKRKDLEAENMNNELEVKDATLKERQTALEADIATKKDELANSKPPEGKELTPEEVEKYWNKK